ncbi:MAG: GNAT family N-acetyltransferase, partial [Saprospiraceae bacterium]|nr:GNAT family N-acetyltransferase [Saprospiraceae bacterium]
MYLQFTPLGLEDITLIQHLGRASYEPYYRHIWHPGGIDWYMDLCFNEASLRKELSDPNVTYLLPQTENGEIIGLLKLLLLKPAPNHLEDNALYLEKIYLMPAFYGKGMGQLLMQYVFETAQSLNRAAVWLMVLKN